MEPILIKITALSGWIFAALGSALSVFVDYKGGATKVSLLIYFIASVLLAHLIGGAIIEHFKIIPNSFIADTIKLFVGYLAIGTLQKIKQEVPLAIEAARKRWIG